MIPTPLPSVALSYERRRISKARKVLRLLALHDDVACGCGQHALLDEKPLTIKPRSGRARLQPRATSAALSAGEKCMAIAQANPTTPITAIGEAAWTNDSELMGGQNSLQALAPGCAERFGPVISVLTFANSHVVDTAEGLVMIDCGTPMAAGLIQQTVKEFSDKPLHTAIYTHGHTDHISLNYMTYEEENAKQGRSRVRVIGHENVAPRFDRYRATNGYNTIINKRQFQLPDWYKFTELFRYPDVYFKDYMRFELGGEVFELFHGKGETDDATIIWMPRHRYCFVGDFFIWNAPNAGNPQKVQRYPLQWIEAAQKVLDLRPEIVFPGHGPPLIGEARVQEAFAAQRDLLHAVCTQAMIGINAGQSLTSIMRSVVVPQDLLQKPYLKPNYDDPRWFAASLWREKAGWYTQEVTRLFPVGTDVVGTEIVKLVGGAEALAAHALKIKAEQGADRLGVALELADLAAASAGAPVAAHRARGEVLRALQQRETSLMAQSIYKAAAIDSEKEAERLSKL